MEFEDKPIDLEYRKYLYDLANKYSNEYVYDILKKMDPEAAKTIHFNNLKRVIRAIEYAKYYNQNKSEHMQSELKKDKSKIPYNFYIFAIDYDRQVLYDRINKRVDQMMDQNLLDEAKYVYEKNLPKEATCMQAIGYKEFFEYFEKKQSLEECVEKLKQNTRRYAKRQLTWFKNMKNIIWLDSNKTKENMCDEILRIVYERK